MEELDLKEIFNIFWKRKIAMVVILVVAIVIGVVYSYFVVKPQYASFTTALLKQENTYLQTGERVEQTNLESLVPTYMELIKSNTVLKETKDALNNLHVGSIEVSQIEDTEMVKITVTHSNPEHAAKVANKLVEVANKKIKELYKIENIYVIDEAEVSNIPCNINHKKDIVIFSIMGIVVACGYALLISVIKS